MHIFRGRHGHNKHGEPDIIELNLTTNKEKHPMTYKRKVILMRFMRSLAAVVVSAAAAWAAGPDAAELVGDQMQAVIVAFGVPALISLDKFLRYGADADDQ